jgi:hypothetical protein
MDETTHPPKGIQLGIEFDPRAPEFDFCALEFDPRASEFDFCGLEFDP